MLELMLRVAMLRTARMWMATRVSLVRMLYGVCAENCAGGEDGDARVPLCL